VCFPYIRYSAAAPDETRFLLSSSAEKIKAVELLEFVQ
jgi:hypothetical protein